MRKNIKLANTIKAYDEQMMLKM